jgi:ELWxxDGT repeat protein
MAHLSHAYPEGSSLYFTNVANPEDIQPWITDGTPAGTRQVAALDGGEDYSSIGFMEFRGKILMAKDAMSSSDFLETVFWQTDGTPQGTTRLGGSGWPGLLGYPSTKGYLVIGQNLVYAGDTTLTGGEIYVVPNDRPLAGNDYVRASTEEAVTVDILANDVDRDGTLVRGTLRIIQQPAHGTARIAADGTITYTPEAGFSGTDTFTYALSDDQGFESPPATVSVTTSGKSKGGGGAMQWWTVLILALLAVSAARARARQPHRWNR